MRHAARIAALLLAVLWPATLGRAQLGTEGGVPTAPPFACTGAPLPELARPALPHFAAALRPGGQVDVLALGSATLLGPHGGVAGSMPDRMAQALQATLPRVKVRVALRASPAASAAEMLTILRKELGEQRYQLVLWQTGTVEALRTEPPEQFRHILEDGAAAVAAARADLVLIDMPYSRLLSGKADLEPYRAAMAGLADRPGVALFPRYALTRSWAEGGALALEESAKPERRHTAAMLRLCLGQALARMLAPGS
jgi:hypothetical protein